MVGVIGEEVFLLVCYLFGGVVFEVFDDIDNGVDFVFGEFIE